MKDELTGIPWIIEWYKNLTGWRSFVYGSIIVGVGMFIAKRIFPMFDKIFDKILDSLPNHWFLLVFACFQSFFGAFWHDFPLFCNGNRTIPVVWRPGSGKKSKDSNHPPEESRTFDKILSLKS